MNIDIVKNIVDNQNYKTVIVTKMQDNEDLKTLVENGYTTFGENKYQEIVRKKDLFPTVSWHFIGRLQSNKITGIVKDCKLIHSVATFEHLKKIDIAANNQCKVQDVLIQLNIANEKTKAGFRKEEIWQVLIDSLDFKNVNICGIMVIGDHTNEENKIENTFIEAQKIFNELQLNNANIKYLSMGMSNDYNIAIQHGANLLRLGSVIFKD